MKLPKSANDNLIDRTQEFWQPRCGRELSQDDARQIAENVTGFFSLLAKWSLAELADPANDNGNLDGSDVEGVDHDQ